LRMAARCQHLSPGLLADAVGTLDGAFKESPVCHRKNWVDGRSLRKWLNWFGVPRRDLNPCYPKPARWFQIL